MYSRLTATGFTLLGAVCFVVIAVLFVFYLHGIQPDSKKYINKFSVAEFSTNPDPSWNTTSLPHDWHLEGLLNHSQLRYRFSLNVSPVAAEIYALYLPVISQNVVVYINGKEIGNGGSTTKPMARNWPGPLIFPIAQSSLIDGDNELALVVLSEPDGRGLLPEFYFGTWTNLVPSYNYRTVLKKTASGAFMMILVATAFFLFLIALHRSDSPEYAWGGATLLGLSGRILPMFFHSILVPPFIWEWWQHMCMGFTVLFILFFVNRLFKIRMKFIEISAMTFVIVLSVLSFIFGSNAELQPLYIIHGAGLWGVCSLVIGSFSVFIALSNAVLNNNRPALYLFCVGCVMLTLGSHDMLMVNGFLTRENGYLLHYASPLVALFVTSILITRLIDISKSLEDLNGSLEQRIEESNKELSESYEKVQKMEREKFLATERERFNRNMHDGLGGHLSTALALAELDAGPNASLTQTIRDATDEMRLMMDTTEAMGEDIGMIIGSLREKLQRQTEASGFKLGWCIEDTSPINGLNYGSVLNVIRIVQEAVTNAVKHSGGDAVHVSVKEIDHVVLLEIADNGMCLSLDTGDGSNGIRNIRKRANELDAKINFYTRSKIGGLSVILSLPIDNGD